MKLDFKKVLDNKNLVAESTYIIALINCFLKKKKTNF